MLGMLLPTSGSVRVPLRPSAAFYLAVVIDLYPSLPHRILSIHGVDARHL